MNIDLTRLNTSCYSVIKDPWSRIEHNHIISYFLIHYNLLPSCWQQRDCKLHPRKLLRDNETEEENGVRPLWTIWFKRDGKWKVDKIHFYDNWLLSRYWNSIERNKQCESKLFINSTSPSTHTWIKTCWAQHNWSLALPLQTQLDTFAGFFMAGCHTLPDMDQTDRRST